MDGSAFRHLESGLLTVAVVILLVGVALGAGLFFLASLIL